MEPPVSDNRSAESAPVLKRTPLYDLHVAHSARMVPFAGYDMPVQYAPGILKEHLHTRAAAGLFDVSHMGQFALRAKSGRLSDAALALERLAPIDVLGLDPGRQRYALFTNAAGGILDDLMVANRGDHLFLVVNAACKEADEAHLRRSLSNVCELERLDRALIAIQGPHAEAALARLATPARDMRFMDVQAIEILGADCVVSRSGYTGEDGFEISIPRAHAHDIATALLEDSAVALIGLGARDSLRLEAGLCLYGADLDPTTTPIEAGLAWAIQPVRRRGGARAGGFPGDGVILQQIDRGATRTRVGFLPDGRAPVRAGSPVFGTEDAATASGIVTSGGFGPSVDRPIAMGTVPVSLSAPGTVLFAEVRGKRMAMTVMTLPFVQTKFKRHNRR